jgi:hypothetical protein
MGVVLVGAGAYAATNWAATNWGVGLCSGSSSAALGASTSNTNIRAVASPYDRQAAAEVCRLATITLAIPSTIMASGRGHHQCSQKTLRLPWPLSRPAQKTPRTTSTAPTTTPMRLRSSLTKTGYRRRTCTLEPPPL